MPEIFRNISVNFTHSNLQNTYSRKGLTLYAYSMKLDVTKMPKNMGQQTTNIQLFIAQIQSFAEGVSKTTKHKVLDLKQLKQSYSVVIQSKLLDIFLESHIWYFAHKIFFAFGIQARHTSYISLFECQVTSSHLIFMTICIGF